MQDLRGHYPIDALAARDDFLTLAANERLRQWRSKPDDDDAAGVFARNLYAFDHGGGVDHHNG